MTGVLWGLVVVLAPTVVACFVMLHRAHARIAGQRLALAAADWRIADLEGQVAAEKQAMEDILTRLRHFSEETEKWKRYGWKAVLPITKALEKEKEQNSRHIHNITDERLGWAAERERYAALLLALWGIVTRAPRALPSAPKPPLALPSGGFLAGRTLLQPDDIDAGSRYWAGERMPSREAVSP